MTPAIVFEVPGEPCAKGRHRSFIRNGKIANFTPDKTVNYEGQVKWLGAMAMKGAPPLEGPLWMHVTAFFQLPKSASKKVRAGILDGTVMGYVTKRPDASNCLKALEDGLNGIAYADDSQLADVRVIRRYSDRPRVVVSIGKLESTQVDCR